MPATHATHLACSPPRLAKRVAWLAQGAHRLSRGRRGARARRGAGVLAALPPRPCAACPCHPPAGRKPRLWGQGGAFRRPTLAGASWSRGAACRRRRPPPPASSPCAPPASPNPAAVVGAPGRSSACAQRPGCSSPQAPAPAPAPAPPPPGAAPSRPGPHRQRLRRGCRRAGARPGERGRVRQTLARLARPGAPLSAPAPPPPRSPRSARSICGWPGRQGAPRPSIAGTPLPHLLPPRSMAAQAGLSDIGLVGLAVMGQARCPGRGRARKRRRSCRRRSRQPPAGARLEEHGQAAARLRPGRCRRLLRTEPGGCMTCAAVPRAYHRCRLLCCPPRAEPGAQRGGEGLHHQRVQPQRRQDGRGGGARGQGGRGRPPARLPRPQRLCRLAAAPAVRPARPSHPPCRSLGEEPLLRRCLGRQAAGLQGSLPLATGCCRPALLPRQPTTAARHRAYPRTLACSRVIILVKAGAPVDATIEQLSQYMEPGDIIIDGGNEWCAPGRRGCCAVLRAAVPAPAVPLWLRCCAAVAAVDHGGGWAV